MKKKLLSLLLVLCMLLASFSMLVACQTEDEDEDPAGSTVDVAKKTDKLVSLLTADTLKDIVAEVKDAYLAAPELDVQELLKDVNVHADYEGNTVSMKDGYLVVVDAEDGDRNVIGFKDGYAINAENGVAEDCEQIIYNISNEEFLQYVEMVNGMIDEYSAMAAEIIPAITKSDIEYKNGWFCIKESYLKKVAMNVLPMVMGGGEAAPMDAAAEQPDMEAMMEQMIDGILAQVDITIGLALDGEAINGFKLAVAANDLETLVTSISPDAAGFMSGSVSMNIEAKLTADLSAFHYFDVTANMDSVQNDVAVKEDLDVRIEYANNTMTVDADIFMDAADQKFDIEGRVSLAHDADMMPTVLTANAKVILANQQINYASGSYQIGSSSHSIYAYGYADMAIEANVFVDFGALAGSGKVVDVTVKSSTSNEYIEARPVTFGYYDEEKDEYIEEVIVSAEDVEKSLTDEMKAKLNDYSEANFNLTAGLTTANGEGTFTATMKSGENEQTVAVEIAVNTNKALAATDAEKQAIAEFDVTINREIYWDIRDICSESFGFETNHPSSEEYPVDANELVKFGRWDYEYKEFNAFVTVIRFNSAAAAEAYAAEVVTVDGLISVYCEYDTVVVGQTQYVNNIINFLEK